MTLKLHRGIDREAVRRGFERKPTTVSYRDVLEAEDIRETVAGIREAGSPEEAQPLLVWLASHPNAPLDVLRDLLAQGSRELLMSLCLNPNLPEDMERLLREHPDAEVREHAEQVFARRHRN